MILSEKILTLRKQCNWSQEDLAEKCGVSRQSVSKWEGGISIPDLDKILLLSQLFGVSTDFLLKDNLTFEETDISAADECDSNVRRVSLAEANDFMELSAKNAPQMAFGVSLCIVSPIPLLLCIATEAPAMIALGLVLLLIIVTCATAFLIINGRPLEAYQYLEREPIELEYGISGIVTEKSKTYEPVFTKFLVRGISLCILSPVVLLITAIMNAPTSVILASICLLLAIVSTAVNLFVRSGMIKESYDKLLQINDYEPLKKQSGKLIDKIAPIYWLLITACYLAYSLYTAKWGTSWIIWPVAGVIFAAIVVTCEIIQKNRS